MTPSKKTINLCGLSIFSGKVEGVYITGNIQKNTQFFHQLSTMLPVHLNVSICSPKYSWHCVKIILSKYSINIKKSKKKLKK